MAAQQFVYHMDGVLRMSGHAGAAPGSGPVVHPPGGPAMQVTRAVDVMADGRLTGPGAPVAPVHVIGTPRPFRALRVRQMDARVIMRRLPAAPEGGEAVASDLGGPHRRDPVHPDLAGRQAGAGGEGVDGMQGRAVRGVPEGPLDRL